MGRLIDTSDLHNQVMLNKRGWGIFATTIDDIIEGVVSQVQTAEAISKADYEEQLKNDLVAIVLEIQIEIEEIPRYRMTHDGICVYRQPSEYIADVSNVIKKVIDGLREESED